MAKIPRKVKVVAAFVGLGLAAGGGVYYRSHGGERGAGSEGRNSVETAETAGTAETADNTAGAPVESGKIGVVDRYSLGKVVLATCFRHNGRPTQIGSRHAEGDNRNILVLGWMLDGMAVGSVPESAFSWQTVVPSQEGCSVDAEWAGGEATDLPRGTVVTYRMAEGAMFAAPVTLQNITLDESGKHPVPPTVSS